MKEVKEYIRPVATFLVGPPASGKSTWVEKFRKNEIIISRDEIVDNLRKGTGMSYSDTFKDPKFQDMVNIALQNLINKVIKSGESFTVDMTNMTRRGRAKILDKLSSRYFKIAVIFEVSRSELSKRLKQRELETGKRVGENIVDDMIKSYQEPTLGEFDNIIKI